MRRQLPAAQGRPAPRAVGVWRRFHPWTLFVGLLLQLHLAYLLGVDAMNPVPEPAQLVQVPIEVVEVQGPVPHLQVRLVDDTQRSMEFPVSAALFAPLHTPLDTTDWDSLPGCMGYALGVPMHWVRDERFRIWELHCGPVHRVHAEFKAAYESAARDAERVFEWHGGVALFLTLVVLGLEWRASRRGEGR